MSIMSSLKRSKLKFLIGSPNIENKKELDIAIAANKLIADNSDFYRHQNHQRILLKNLGTSNEDIDLRNSILILDERAGD